MGTRVRFARRSGSRQSGARGEGERASGGAVVLLGNPNVGKSVLFGALTGAYVTVSNYPGTTVEVAKGWLRHGGKARPVVDLPGIHSLAPHSDDEWATLEALLESAEATAVLVMDAKNLERGLLLALELADAGLPFVVSLNMVDEAKARGVTVNPRVLAEALGVPVTPTIAIEGTGLEALSASLEAARPAGVRTVFPAAAERAIEEVAALMPPAALAPRALACLALLGDDRLLAHLGLTEQARSVVRKARAQAEHDLAEPLGFALTRERLATAARLAAAATASGRGRARLLDRVSPWTTHPLTGWPILAIVLLLMYLLVGTFGAGTVVDALESVFQGSVNPWVTRALEASVP